MALQLLSKDTLQNLLDELGRLIGQRIKSHLKKSPANQAEDQQNDTSAEEQTESFPAVTMPGDVPALSHEEYLPSAAHGPDQSVGGAGDTAAPWTAAGDATDTSADAGADEWPAGSGTGYGSADVEIDVRSAKDEATDPPGWSRAGDGTTGAGTQAWPGSEAAEQTIVDEAGEPATAEQPGDQANGDAVDDSSAASAAGVVAGSEAAEQPAKSAADGDTASLTANGAVEIR